MTITKEMVKLLRIDIDAALEEISRKHGIVLTAGNMSYSPSEVNIKVKGFASTPGAESAKDVMLDRYRATFELYVARLGENLTKDDLGKSIRSGNFNKKLTIVGMDTRKRKYPIVLMDEQGNRYNASPAQIRKSLGR